MLFYKWISDVCGYNHEQALDDLADDCSQELEEEECRPFSSLTELSDTPLTPFDVDGYVTS